QGLQFFKLQQVGVQLEGARTLALQFFKRVSALSEVIAIHVADADEFNPANLQRRLDILHAVPTATNQTHPDRPLFFGPPDQARYLAKRNGPQSRALQELAASDGLHARRMPKQA